MWLSFVILQILPETKLKYFGLVGLTQEISRQYSIDCAVCLLVTTLMQISNEKDEAGQREIQKLYSFKRKRTIKSVMKQSPVIRKIKSLKESLILNGLKCVVTSGKTPFLLPKSILGFVRVAKLIGYIYIFIYTHTRITGCDLANSAMAIYRWVIQESSSYSVHKGGCLSWSSIYT